MAETTINNPQLSQNATKFYTHFLYKAIFVSIFLLLLPLFPSQAPDFINHKTLNTTGWEFLQLVFVGIAVSYGLFSKRNDETHKEDSPFKSDNPQSYVATLLQVSSVFDDDSENSIPSNDKVQTWNSQYYRGEPIVVVAQDSDESTTVEKPLFLPVRSLKTKTGVSETSKTSEISEIDSKMNRFSRSNSRLEEDVVLRSPIPWRSRSGRMEFTEEFRRTPSVHDSSEINQLNKPSQIPPPPPPPPPPPVNSNNTGGKELKRNVRSVPEGFENRGRRSSEFTNRSRSDAGKSVRTRKEMELEENLSHDREIERFMKSQSKKFMDEEIENPKEEEEEVSSGEMVGSDNGPDVDKKADEFIAKFREQIRLQRIASIRKSTTTQNGNR